MATLRFWFHQKEYRVKLGDRLSIGSADDDDVSIPSASLSPHQALLTRTGENRFRLADNERQDRIGFRGQKVEALDLEDGLGFSLGDLEFKFYEVEPEPAAAATEAQPASPGAALAPARPAGGGPVRDPTDARPTPLTERLKAAREAILDEISKVIVGQKAVLNQVLVALFARGHCLLIGVPGLAKTLMVKVVGGSLNLVSRRIQFTPDLMPSDITGTDILEEDSATGKREFRFHRGPLFANLLLADEINRTPPKTQAALLEAMQECRVTVSGTTYPLPEPFMVLATQNPIEQEGTYPLPEAQLDRFMFCIHLDYPSAAEEQQVLLETTRDAAWNVRPVLTAAEVLQFQRLVRQVPVSQHVAAYALNLIRATRPTVEGAPEFITRWVRWGAGTRAGQYLLLAAKAQVLLEGRFSVSCADVKRFALPVLRHRIFTNFTAASEGMTTDKIVGRVLEIVKEPVY